MLNNATVIKKTSTLFSLLSIPVMLFWGTMNQDSSAAMIVILFQYDTHKPKTLLHG
jgi:hypothetical protein